MKDLNYINRCLRWLANAIVNEYQDKSLSPLMEDKMNKFYSSVNTSIEWDDLTRDDFLSLGFMCYGYEQEDPYELWLIPIWLYPIIPDGLQLEDIHMNSFLFNRETTPYETFYGCMTYGIKISNPCYKKSIEEILQELD